MSSCRDAVDLDPLATIRCFAVCVMIGLGLALTFHAVMRFTGMNWPWTSFLFTEQDRFNDWHNSVAQAASGDPYFFHGTPALATYFPGAYLMFGMAVGLGRDASTLLYLAVSELLLGAAVFSMTLTAARHHPVAVRGGRLEIPLLLVLSLLCSYPVLFALDRGNVDLWIAACCTLFVASLGTRFSVWGLTALAIAISIKGYPAAFLALSLARRDFRGVMFCVAAVVGITALALLWVGNGMAHDISGLRNNVQLFIQRYVVGGDSLFASSDPYNAIRLLIVAQGGGATVEEASAMLLHIYTPVILLFACVCAFFVLAVPAPAWRRVTAVCLVAILFPNVANDYKLCGLFPGMLLLLVSGVSGRRKRISLVLFGLLMIPKSYFFFGIHSLSMFVNPMLLAGLAWQAIADRTAWRRGLRLLRFRLPWYVAALPHASLRLD